MMRNSFGIILAVFVSACAAGMPAKPEVQVIKVPVDRIVQRNCPDKRQAPEMYPDTDAVLSTFAADDYEGLAKVFHAGRDKRDARLTVDDVQIKTCSGD